MIDIFQDQVQFEQWVALAVDGKQRMNLMWMVKRALTSGVQSGGVF